MPHPPPVVPLVLGMLVIFYVIVPLLVLIHELGHAVAAIHAGRRPTVRIGVAPPLISRRFHSFDLHLNRLPLDYFYPRTPRKEVPKTPMGVCQFDPTGLTVGQIRTFLSAGPHASILAGLAVGLAAWLLTPGSFAFWLAASTSGLSLYMGFGNLIPRRREGRFFTDGAKMWRLRHVDADAVVPRRSTP